MLTAAPLAHAFSEWGSRPGVPHSWGSEISASRAMALGRGGRSRRASEISASRTTALGQGGRPRQRALPQ